MYLTMGSPASRAWRPAPTPSSRRVRGRGGRAPRCRADASRRVLGQSPRRRAENIDAKRQMSKNGGRGTGFTRIGSHRGRTGTDLDEPEYRSLHSAKWHLGTSKPSRDIKRGGNPRSNILRRARGRERDSGRRARAADAPTRSPSLGTSPASRTALKGLYVHDPPLACSAIERRRNSLRSLATRAP